MLHNNYLKNDYIGLIWVQFEIPETRYNKQSKITSKKLKDIKTLDFKSVYP